jgi:hypothetical protein
MEGKQFDGTYISVDDQALEVHFYTEARDLWHRISSVDVSRLLFYVVFWGVPHDCVALKLGLHLQQSFRRS